MGTYILYRGQRHHPSDHWLVSQLYGAQAAANDRGDRIHSVQCLVWACPKPARADFFRVLQGVTGEGLQPLSQAVLLEEFPGRERGKAMAFWGVGIVAAPILGPTLGGWITDSYSWRWVFYINVPVGILSLSLIYLFIYDPPYIRRGALRVDLC